MIKPTIHLNGTSADDLFEQYGEIATTLRTAISALEANQPNGRDYYPQGMGAIQIATEEHRQRILRVEAVLDEIEELRLHIMEQQEQREAAKKR